jgi:hypothetical protein
MHELLDVKGPPNPEIPGTGKVLAHHVHSMNREEILMNILAKMFHKSIVIKVIDMANFEGS